LSRSAPPVFSFYVKATRPGEKNSAKFGFKKSTIQRNDSVSKKQLFRVNLNAVTNRNQFILRFHKYRYIQIIWQHILVE